MEDLRTYRFGVFEVEPGTGEIRKAGRRIRLQPQPFKFLVALLANPGEVVSRDDLRQQLWTTETFVDFDQGLNFCVRQARAALGDDADRPRYIETVPRRGYRFIAPLQPPVPATATAATPPDQPSRFFPGAFVLAVVVLTLVVVTAVWQGRDPRGGERASADRLIQFELTPAPDGAFAADMMPAIAPDGGAIVYAADGRLGRLLSLRTMSDSKLRPLAGTEGATFPFWSPGGNRIGFFADGLLKTIDLAAGTVTTIAAVAEARGGAWNSAGVLLIGRRNGPLLMVPSSGGPPTAIAASGDPAEHAAAWPYFLPDNRHFLFTNRHLNRDLTGIYLGELGSTVTKRLLPDQANAVYADGQLFYAREPFKEHVPLFSAWRSVIVNRATLMAQRFDPVRLELRGNPVAIAGDLRYWALRGLATFSVSAHGTLAFRKADAHPRTRLKWFDRTGHVLGDFGEDTFYPHPEISPDGSKVAYMRVDTVGGNADIWIADLVRNLRTRFTFDPSVDSLPVWSPDGERIAFASDRQGPSDIFVKPISGSSVEQRVGRSRFVMFPTGWSPDGRVILFQHHQGSVDSLDAIPLAHPDAAWSFAANSANDASAQFSPDGRWVAHASGRGDRIPALGAQDSPQLIVQDFPAHAGTWQLTADNGWEPRWRRDGRELFFLSIARDGRADAMAAAVNGSGSAFTFAPPRRLFSVPVWMGPPTPRNHYDVSRDGQRFLIGVVVEPATTEALTVVSGRRPIP